MLTYRLLEERDLETRVEWMNDPRIYKTMHFTPPITLEGTQAWFERNKGSDSRRDFVLEDDGEIAVMNGLTGREHHINKVESYTIVNPNTKGKGYGKTSLCLKCWYAFYVWKINKVWAYIDADNIASLRMCKSVGFMQEGILREEVARNEALIDRVYVGILKEDFNMNLFNEYKKRTTFLFPNL